MIVRLKWSDLTSRGRKYVVGLVRTGIEGEVLVGYSGDTAWYYRIKPRRRA